MAHDRRRRRLGLGDALSDAIAAIGSGDSAAATALASETTLLTNLQDSTPSVYTNYSAGMLNGWFRAFDTSGNWTNIPAPDGPGAIGSPPSAQDWAQFDAAAAQLGVGGWIAAVKEHAVSNGNTLDKVTTAVANAEAMLDHFVPGWSIAIDLLAPAMPFLPAVSALLGASAGVSSDLASAAVGQILNSTNATANLFGFDASGLTSPISELSQNAIAQSLQPIASAAAQNLDALTPLQASLAKEIQIASTTNGSALDKLEAVAVEGAQEVILALQIAASVAGTPAAGAALSGAALALKATLAGALAQGDAAAKLEAAGWVIAKGAPALLTSFAGGVVASIPELSSTTVDVAGLETSLATVVKGAASLEGATLAAGASIAQAELAAQQIKSAADKSRAAAQTQAAALDAQTAQLEAELAGLKAQLTTLERAKLGARTALAAAASSPLATAAVATALGLLLREVLK